MKIRTGFVSNSSSSSFLVWFTTMPQSVEELKALLFGDKQEIEEFDYTVATSVAAAIIWQDLQNQQPATAEDMRDELRPLAYTNVYARGRCGRYYQIEDPEQRRKLRAEEDADIADELDRLVEQSRQYEGQPYRFHYSDNDGEIMRVLEHGGVFQSLQHVRISHH